MEPGRLPSTGDEDAAGAFGPILLDREDGAVAVEDSEAEGGEDGGTPGYERRGRVGAVEGAVEAEELEDEDGNE